MLAFPVEEGSNIRIQLPKLQVCGGCGQKLQVIDTNEENVKSLRNLLISASIKIDSIQFRQMKSKNKKRPIRLMIGLLNVDSQQIDKVIFRTAFNPRTRFCSLRYKTGNL